MAMMRYFPVALMAVLLAATPAQGGPTVTWQHKQGEQFDTLLADGKEITPDIYSDPAKLSAFLKQHDMDFRVVIDLNIPKEAWNTTNDAVAWPKLPAPLAAFLDQVALKSLGSGCHSGTTLVYRSALIYTSEDGNLKYLDSDGKWVSWSKVRDRFVGPTGPRPMQTPAILDVVSVSGASLQSAIMNSINGDLPAELLRFLAKNHVVLRRFTVPTLSAIGR
jgi:hypothetical protein